MFPALIWAALRLGRHGATVAVAVAAGFAVWETSRQVGPFAYESITYSVLSTQLYIAVAAVSTLCLAAVVAERERAAERLAASRARLVEAADNERRRIEHNLHDGAQQRLTGARRAAAASSPTACETNPSVAAGLFDDAAPGARRSRSTSCASSPTASTRPSCGTSASPAPSESIALRSTLPIQLVELPATRAWTPTAEATAYFVIAEALTNARKHAGRDVDDGAAPPRRGASCRSRSPTTASAARRHARVGPRGPARPRRGRRRHAADRQPGRRGDEALGVDPRRAAA